MAAPFIVEKCKRDAPKHWERFYRQHGDKFFLDRHWLGREFEDVDALAETELGDGSAPKTLLEVGCGAGNAIWPLVESHQHLRVFACDFAPKAVELVQSHPAYDPSRVTAFVHDLTEPTPSLRSRIGGDEGAGADLVTCLFVLSAVPPEKLSIAVRAMADALKPGGVLLLREHARGDSAQLRFHTRKSAGYSEPSLLSADRPLYRRADWTLMLFLGVRGRVDGPELTARVDGRDRRAHARGRARGLEPHHRAVHHQPQAGGDGALTDALTWP